MLPGDGRTSQDGWNRYFPQRKERGRDGTISVRGAHAVPQLRGRAVAEMKKLPISDSINNTYISVKGNTLKAQLN